MATPQVLDITGSREQFVEGLRRYDSWAETYRPTNEAAFLEAHRAIVSGDMREVLDVLSRVHGGLREAMNSDDLPILLAASVRTRLMQSYGAVAQPWRGLVNEESLPDLEQWTAAGLMWESDDQKGNATPSNLIPEVPEGHGYDEARVSEVSEYAQLKTYGLVWSLTRRMMLADNLRSLNRMSGDAGQAMARTQNYHFVDLLENSASTTVSGKVLKDGTRLFASAAARGNLHTGSLALSAANVKAELLLYGAQTDRAGITNNRNGIQARYLVVPSALMLTAMEICDPAPRITGESATTTQTNLLASMLTPIVVPELTSSVDWYLAASPGAVPGLVYGTLNGRQEPEYFTQLENAHLAEADGNKQKIRHDFGFWAEQWHTWRKIDDAT